MDRWLPPNAAAHGAQIDAALSWVHLLMAAVFAIGLAFFLTALWRFRRSRHPAASHAGLTGRFPAWLEAAVVVAEGALLVGVSMPLWAARVERIPPERDAVVVRVVSEQFAWNVHYPGPDGRFGRTALHLIDLQRNPLGLDRADPAAADDVTTVNQLYLPVDRPVIVHLSSKDVIHSFNVPQFRIKQDAVPGLSIPVWWVPTVTTEEMRRRLGQPGFVYEIACAQLCGAGHYRMRGFVTVLEQDEFKTWLEGQVADPPPTSLLTPAD
ncbi:MAG TPA: hypothetical protein VEL74_16370 [Thermoanaerobaculia bacterium]|nr:hypothetical protein [Thermoanaerobaculia bacterium]